MGQLTTLLNERLNVCWICRWWRWPESAGTKELRKPLQEKWNASRLTSYLLPGVGRGNLSRNFIFCSFESWTMWLCWAVFILWLHSPFEVGWGQSLLSRVTAPVCPSSAKGRETLAPPASLPDRLVAPFRVCLSHITSYLIFFSFFFVSELQVHPFLPCFEILLLDPVNSSLLPAGAMLGFASRGALGDTVRWWRGLLFQVLIRHNLIFPSAQEPRPQWPLWTSSDTSSSFPLQF